MTTEAKVFWFNEDHRVVIARDFDDSPVVIVERLTLDAMGQSSWRPEDSHPNTISMLSEALLLGVVRVEERALAVQKAVLVEDERKDAEIKKWMDRATDSAARMCDLRGRLLARIDAVLGGPERPGRRSFQDMRIFVANHLLPIEPKT
jgi:hypothetical protein